MTCHVSSVSLVQGVLVIMVVLGSPGPLNVKLEPSQELRFSGDFRTKLVQSLVISNPGKIPILFKIKTTSPHRYVVKPHKGVVQGNAELKIAITLLPFYYKPDSVYHDKFLIIACLENQLNVEYFKKDFLNMVPLGEKFEKKIPCHFQEIQSIENSSDQEDHSAISEVDEQLVKRIVYGDELMEKEKKLLEANKELSALKLKERELKLLNKKLKQETKKSKQELLITKESGINADNNLPVLYVIFFCCLILAVGIVTGKFLSFE